MSPSPLDASVSGDSLDAKGATDGFLLPLQGFGKTILKELLLEEPEPPWEDRMDIKLSQLQADGDGEPEPPWCLSDQREEPEPPCPLSDRASICERLCRTPFLPPRHPLFMHGRGYAGPLHDPRKTRSSNKSPLKSGLGPIWLTASEFQDEPEVATAKIHQVATLLRLSRKTVVYTSSSSSSQRSPYSARHPLRKPPAEKKLHSRSAKPTFSHYALSFLGQQGLIHSWVQQNPDGSPQKAGFPQERVNEVHGSWYDPSNPVVKYSGTLNERAYAWMRKDAETADLVLVFGTGMNGLNADQVMSLAAERSICPFPGLGYGLGLVCFGQQQTEMDGKMTIRLFGLSDDHMHLLLHELGFGLVVPRPPPRLEASFALVPYYADGRRIPEGEGRRMWLDLRDGQLVRVTPGHNIQGARQSQYLHIGSAKPVMHKGDVRLPAQGLGYVVRREEATCSFVLEIEGATMRLGIWWLEAAVRGHVQVIPVVNQKPEFEGSELKLDWERRKAGA